MFDKILVGCLVGPFILGLGIIIGCAAVEQSSSPVYNIHQIGQLKYEWKGGVWKDVPYTNIYDLYIVEIQGHKYFMMSSTRGMCLGPEIPKDFKE